MKGDCTFKQDSFRKWLPAVGPYWSYDLSCATDRFPVDFQQRILGALVGDDYAMAWKRLLTDQAFMAQWNQTEYKYAVGQPMGAYSS